MWLPAIIAAVSTFGAAAAGVAYRVNESRLARYQTDAFCSAPLSAPARPDGSVCTVEQAQVAARWIRTSRSSRYYNVALRTRDGGVDSVALEGTVRRDLWNTATVGAWVLVQRFADSRAHRRHVTVVRASDLVSPTTWNPVWRNTDAIAGIVFLSVIAAVSLIALAYTRATQRRDAPQRLVLERVRES